MKKNRKITITTSEDIYQTWLITSDKLTKSKIFRNKTEIIESLIYFLEKANPKEIEKIKKSVISN